MGRFSREKQYADHLEKKFKEINILHQREYRIGDTGNIVDFVIDDKLLLDLKAKRLVTRDDYYQMQRYLQTTNKQLGLIVNFRNRFLKPIRIIRLDTDAKKRFI